VLFCAVYAELCAMFLVADSDIMPCVHCGILAGLSVPKEFSRMCDANLLGYVRGVDIVVVFIAVATIITS